MNKFAVLVAAIVLALGFSQCRKPVFNFDEHNSNDITKSITFVPCKDNSKFGITDNSGTMICNWNDGDKLQIYGSSSGTFGEENSHYCGELTYSEKAFRGLLNNVPTGSSARLRFYFFGSGFDETTKSCQVDLSTQDGKLNVTKDGVVGVASKLVAVSSDLEVKDTYNNEKLIPQVAVVKFSFKQFGSGKDIYFSGFTKRDINVTPEGVLEYGDATSSILTQAGGKEFFYLMIIPEGVKNYEFRQSNPDNFFVYTQEFALGKFYHGGSGSALEVKRLIVPGEFSVSATKKVNFTTGNLQYLGKETKWRFATNQWDRMANGPSAEPVTDRGNVTVYGYENGEYNYYETGQTEKNKNSARDLFCWASSGIGGHGKPYVIGTNNAYDNDSDNLCDGDGTADWGKNTIYGRNDWRTLTAAEYQYLIDYYDKTQQAEGRKVKDKDGNDVKPYGYGTVHGIDGMIILPDNWEGKINGTKIDFTYGISAYENNFSEITTPKWSDMENAGVVFLPHAGVLFYKNSGGTYSYSVINLHNGYYWSSTAGVNCGTTSGVGVKGAGRLNFCWEESVGKLYCPYPYNRYMGYSVRLVRDVVSEGNGSAEGFDSGSW